MSFGDDRLVCQVGTHGVDSENHNRVGDCVVSS